MSVYKKLLLSSPAILSILLFIMTEIKFPLFNDLPIEIELNLFRILFLTLTSIQIILLLRILLSLKHLGKSLIRSWTWGIILLPLYAGIVFVWFKLDEFKKMNSENEKRSF